MYIWYFGDFIIQMVMFLIKKWMLVIYSKVKFFTCIVRETALILMFGFFTVPPHNLMKYLIFGVICIHFCKEMTFKNGGWLSFFIVNLYILSLWQSFAFQKCDLDKFCFFILHSHVWRKIIVNFICFMKTMSRLFTKVPKFTSVHWMLGI